MSSRDQIATIVPKKYRSLASIFESPDLESLESGLRRLNEQSSVAWFIEALAIYGILYDSELYSSSGLTWKQYKAETGKRLNLPKQEFSDYFLAGRFLKQHGKKLFAAGFNPVRSCRKLARADLALRLCGDVDTVIDRLINDQWEEFHAWYMELKKLAEPGPVARKAKRVIAILNGKVFINGREPIRIAKTVTKKEREDLEKIVADYFKSKVK